MTNSATADTIVGTAGNDTITGASGTVVAGDLIIDQSSTDNDTANLVLTANYTPDNITKIENINLDWNAYTTPTYTLTNVSGAEVVTLTSSKVGYLGSANIVNAGTTTIVAGSGTVGTLDVDGITNATVTGTSATALVVDGTATNANNIAVVVNAGANTTNITIGGTNGFKSTTLNAGTATTIAVTDAGNTTDTTTITVNADATITNANTGATTLVLSDGNDITMAAIGNGLIVQGEGNVVIIANDAFDAATETVTNSKTSGTLTIKDNDTQAANFSAVHADLIVLTGNKNGVDTVANGANLSYTATATTLIDVTVTGTGTSDAVSVELTGASHTAVEASGVETLTITANATNVSGADVSIGTLTTNANTIKFLGTNDVAIAAVADEAADDAGTIDASGLTGALTIATASTDDDIEVMGGTGILSYTTSNQTGNVSATGQSANDTVTANATTTGSVTAILADGANTVSATGLTTGTLVVTGGSGIDTITAGAALTTGTINLSLGDGANVINLDDGVGAGTRTVTTGGGDDTLTFTGSLDNANDVLNWTGGAGTDTLVLATDGADLSVSNVTLSGVEVIKILVDGGADATAEAKLAAADVSGTTLTIKASAYNANNQVEIVGAATTSTIDLSGLTIDQSVTYGVAGVIVNASANTTTAQTITATSIADTITGGGAADTITAGNGADTITGGDGNDSIDITETLANSAVDNVFLDAAGDGVDTITGFRVGTDTISFGDAATIATGGVSVMGTTAATVVAGIAFDISDVTQTTTDVTEIAATLTSNGNLALANDGTELLKALSSTTTAATQLTASGAADFFVVAYQNSDAYIYFASSADANVIASEITLVGIVDSITAGAMTNADFIAL